MYCYLAKHAVLYIHVSDHNHLQEDRMTTAETFFIREAKKIDRDNYNLTCDQYVRNGMKLVKTGEFEKVVRFGKIDPKVAAKISINHSKDINSIVIYDDKSNPVSGPFKLMSYNNRIKQLAALEIVA